MTNENLKVIELSSYTSPKVVEDKRKEWVAYGDDNDYFQHLIDLYNDSPTNNAIINGMVEIINGGGINAKDKTRKPDEWAMLISMLDNEDLRRIVTDLKLMGNAAFQVIYQNGKVKQLYHFPVETLRAEKANEDGEIAAYYYHSNWPECKPTDKPERIDAFGFGNQSKPEILYMKPYRSGYFYYSPVDYQGGLPYCEIEREVAQYHINNIKWGFSATTLISFFTGAGDDQTNREIERSLLQKFSGASGRKMIVGFHNNREEAPQVDDLPVSDADKQYQFVADEAMRKIMVAHRITSPMLLGIKDNTGLGNNADELKTASILFEATVVNPFRLLILNALHRVLSVNGASLELYFESLNPWKSEASAEATQLAAIDDRPFLKGEILEDILSRLDDKPIEEDLSDYELIDEAWADDESSEDDLEGMLNAWAKEQMKANETVLHKFKRVLLGFQDDSYQDTDFFKIRYKYQSTTKENVVGETRPLCNRLLKKGIMNKEDIKALSSKGGAESKGQPYDVFLYKGGANCQHGWVRLIYKKRAKKDGTPWGGNWLAGTTKAQIYEAIKDGAKVEQAEAKKALIAPRDTKTRGYKK